MGKKKRSTTRAKANGRTAETERIDPAALSIEQLADLLTRAGGREITSAMIAADLQVGAPQHEGRLNLVEYTAWLARAHGRSATR